LAIAFGVAAFDSIQKIVLIEGRKITLNQ